MCLGGIPLEITHLHIIHVYVYTHVYIYIYRHVCIHIYIYIDIYIYIYMCVFFPLATAWFKLIAEEICPLGDQNCETGRVSKHVMAAKTGLEMERVPPYPLVDHHFPKQNGEESRHLCSTIHIYIYVCGDGHRFTNDLPPILV